MTHYRIFRWGLYISCNTYSNYIYIDKYIIVALTRIDNSIIMHQINNFV